MRFITIYFFLLFGQLIQAQTFNVKIENELSKSQVSVSYLRTFEQLGIKTPGSSELQNTRDWLMDQYKRIGYDSIWLDSFEEGGVKEQNVIAKKEGISDDYILICSHYDTRNGPGVNDNGTGVSATLTAAEALISKTPIRTVYFINFSGEERGFIGSYNFVENSLSKLPGNLYAMINLDQLGGTLGFSGNDKIYCERDEISPPASNNMLSAFITDTIANLAKIYTKLIPVISTAYSSDYLPFEESGYVITGLYQFSACPYVHTPADSFNKMDTVSFVEAVKLVIATTMHFAQIPNFISVFDVAEGNIINQTKNGDIFIRSDLKFKNEIYLTFYDVSGRLLEYYPLILSQNNLIKTSRFGAGAYQAVISDNQDFYMRKLIVVP